MLTWYLDPVHVPTIGYGFTWSSQVFRDWWMKKYGRKMRKGDTISEIDAAAIPRAMIEVEYAPPVDQAFVGKPLQIREPAYWCSSSFGRLARESVALNLGRLATSYDQHLKEQETQEEIEQRAQQLFERRLAEERPARRVSRKPSE